MLSRYPNTGSLTLTVNSLPFSDGLAYFISNNTPFPFSPPIGSASAITPCNLRKVWAFGFPSIPGPADIFLILEGTQPAGFTTMRIQLGDLTTFHDVPISAGEQSAYPPVPPSAVSPSGLLIVLNADETGLTLAAGQQWVFGQSYSISFL